MEVEVSGRGVGVVSSGGRPMRIPAGYRVARVVALLSSSASGAQVTLGVRSLAALGTQMPEHVLATVILAPEAPRVVTPGRRRACSSPSSRTPATSAT